MSTTYKRLGLFRCINERCGRDVMLRENPHGTLSAVCDVCGIMTSAKKGEDAHAWMRAKAPPAAPAPAPGPAPAPAPAPPGKRSPFAMLGVD